jgi:photosystem II stability/assembly factor-like uncharacterized protein
MARKRSVSWTSALAALGLVVTAGAAGPAAQRPAGAEKANIVVDPALFAGLEYRSLGFSRGGRATAVAGVRGQPLVYYFGSTGGGVFKTTDGGLTWTPVSDGFFQAGSIGAIAVADSDPNVVYVGTGSACPRGNVSIGVGVYKSTDAGKTWQHIGLPNAGLIGRIRVHPTNPDLVYVAVLGNIFGPNDERGVYRSKDGGRTWERVLFVSSRTGAVDLAMDPTNPRVLYAAMWTVERKPWTIHSGSLEGGLFKTTDGGDRWERLSGGLPTDVMVGKIGVAVSPAKPDRVWALVEAAGDRGGVYRSDDAGKTWRRVNSQRMLLQRAWYYTHIYADPKHPDTVYALNTGFYKSTDGGRSWQPIRVPHGDNHDLWINPDDPQIMINSNDGGANVSFNGGQSWTHQMNQPTAEFYRVTVDTRFPYRVYGAQQDNSTASVPSRPPGGFGGGGFGGVDFYAVGGGESGHIAVDPRNPDIVYAGSYGGVITKFNEETRTLESIEVYPEARTGQRAADQKYRFQWNAPIRLSPHNPDVLYMTSQYVHRTQDGGFTWEVISPDLTRNDKSKQDYSGGTGITRDNTGVEVYDVIFAFEESPHKPGLLWAGSDDGLVHISHDNGKTWQNITPKEMPEWGCVNMIDLSAHDPGRAHIAVYKYRQNDFTPYIFQTNDYGKTWRRLTDGKNGIPPNHFVRVVREDPHRKGLLYAGTEFGLYVSFDDGAHWQSLQLNLPVTPITDLYVHPIYKDLVVATQGRAFWILDDLGVLHQLTDRVQTTRNHLFKPEDGYRTGMGPINIFYYLAEEPKQPVRVEILDAKDQVVAAYTSRAGEGEAERPATEEEQFFGPVRPPQVTARKGLNRFAWNARYAPLFEIPRGIVMWGGGGAGSAGPKVVPGRYQVRVTVGDWRATEAFEVRPDPRFNTTTADYEEQLKLAREVGAKIAELYRDLATIREVKRQATDLGERLRRGGFGEEVAKAARGLVERLTAIEGEFTQLQGEGGQDALNFPGRLDNQFVRLYSEIVSDDKRPSKGEYQRFEDLKPELAKLQTQLDQVLKTDLAKFNELVRSKNVPPIIVARPGATTSQP